MRALPDAGLRLVRAGLLARDALAIRALAGVAGGYGLAALWSVAALWLPLPRSEAALAGMQTSFVVYVAALGWAFGARSAACACLGVLGAALPLLALAWPAWLGMLA